VQSSFSATRESRAGGGARPTESPQNRRPIGGLSPGPQTLYHEPMGVGALISLDEYLHTSFHPDCDFMEGEVLKRNVGKKKHSYA
jgi:hypothetical protein